jgi:peptidyl-dipeptidase A
MTTRTRLLTASALAALLAGCSEPASVETDAASGAVPTASANATTAAPTTPAGPTLADAEAFLVEAERLLAENYERQARTFWAFESNITYDTEWLAQRSDAVSIALRVDLANRAAAFNDLDLPADSRRRLELIKLDLTLPAPRRPGAAEELAALSTRLSSAYSTGKVALDGRLFPLDELEVLMGDVRDPTELEEMWTRWRAVPMTPRADGGTMASDYAALVALANEGARELGFADLRDMWLSKYDMSADEMAAEVDRLWGQVKPLYDELHCYVRAELNAEYGDEVVPLSQPLRADILGNMWAQDWSNVYDLVAPEGADIGYDVTELLVDQGYSPHRMVETGEAFFTSLGFDPLPETFWERSVIEKPADRELVCHASAWDFNATDEVRIKMCTKVNEEDFRTIHHELGHNFYQRAYKIHESPLYWNGAHDGFHEAIGDFIALSITPDYLNRIGLIAQDQIPPASADTGLLLQQALDKIAFLPFALTMDKWRWQVLSGETPPEEYNSTWWELRDAYQGVRPPSERPDGAFDPGAKYHIPNNVPYLRYFLSFVMQFQFHQAACEQAGWEGPLHRCSIYGNEEVGARFNAMLEAGASQPWPDTLELFTGTREMDGSSIVAYFAPLMDYLREENEGRSCGW